MIANKLRLVATNPARVLYSLAGRMADHQPRLARAFVRMSLAIERNPAEICLRRGEIALLNHDLAGAVSYLRMAIASQPTVSAIYGLGARLARAKFTDAEFEKAVTTTVTDETLRSMLLWLLRSPSAYHPSRFWLYFMLYNSYQVDTFGIDNFKRSSNKNYFTWTSDVHVKEQTQALQLITRSSAALKVNGEKPADFTEKEWHQYKRFLTSLYCYARSRDRLGILDRLEEPLLGNPIYLEIDGIRVSQDLCHTCIELNSVLPHLPFSADDAFTVYELGAGHGRIGFVLLKLFPRARYVVIDIPPALHTSQWYLSALVDKSEVFRCRDFRSYPEIRNEFEASRVAFLLPHQAELLPHKSADLFINICSIQEMTLEHVTLWFRHIEELCRGYFYTKQYHEHKNDIDRITIKRGDYPVRPDWTAVFDRDCEAFPSLFEALYRIP